MQGCTNPEGCKGNGRHEEFVKINEGQSGGKPLYKCNIVKHLHDIFSKKGL